jgi:hypothetical protein
LRRPGLRRSSATLPIYAYGAVVDNKTGDVVYVD